VGGMERVTVELANNFVDKYNSDVTIVLLRNTSKFYKVNPKVKIVEPNFPFNKIYYLFFAIRTLLYLRSTIKNINPDAVLSMGEKWNTFNLIALLNTNYHVYVSDCSSCKLKLHFFHYWLRVFVYRTAAGIIAQTNEAKEYLKSSTKHSNIVTIGNPIRKILVSTDAPRENIILNVGRFISTKQQIHLVEIFSKVPHKDWKLVFIGSGRHFEEVKLRAIELGIINKVEFIGESKNVDHYYSKSKIFAFTSIVEGFPNVLGEALSAGLACISYDCHSGASDLIKNDDNGYLVKINNMVEYKNKLEILIENEKIRERFANKSSLKIQEFDSELICNKYYQFLLSHEDSNKYS
jgi:GalNAc-alpha-(1->4)-GalNAc-alpha-(1->3)-diNAcBac-PP-undecaprenol alpha-1,4-N-acetyl-D-galactosaminyltransferase